MLNKDLSTASPGERLWLVRQNAGMTQREAADRHGCCLSIYQRYEQDKREPEYLVVPPPLHIGLLCALARRRSGLTLNQVAEALGVSKVTVLTMERAGDSRLVNFWRRKKFLFPKKQFYS